MDRMKGNKGWLYETIVNDFCRGTFFSTFVVSNSHHHQNTNRFSLLLPIIFGMLIDSIDSNPASCGFGMNLFWGNLSLLQFHFYGFSAKHSLNFHWLSAVWNSSGNAGNAFHTLNLVFFGAVVSGRMAVLIHISKFSTILQNINPTNQPSTFILIFFHKSSVALDLTDTTKEETIFDHTKQNNFLVPYCTMKFTTLAALICVGALSTEAFVPPSLTRYAPFFRGLFLACWTNLPSSTTDSCWACGIICHGMYQTPSNLTIPMVNLF